VFLAAAFGDRTRVTYGCDRVVGAVGDAVAFVPNLSICNTFFTINPFVLKLLVNGTDTHAPIRASEVRLAIEILGSPVLTRK